jgi:hypothetical protein
MKKILLTVMAAGLITLGCSKEDDELPEANAGAAVSGSDPLAAASADTGGTAQIVEAFNPSTFGPPPPPMADLGAADRPLGDNGNAMDDLEYLNALVFRFNESRGSYSPEPEPQFRTQEEYQKYAAALKKLKEPITDLNELVRSKVIKAIPPAPTGKKYAINAQTLKVELMPATP